MRISVSGNTFSIAAGTFSTPVDETTTYVYGSNLGLTASTVPIYSNDLLRAVIASNTPQDVANASTNGYNRYSHFQADDGHVCIHWIFEYYITFKVRRSDNGQTIDLKKRLVFQTSGYEGRY